LRVIRDKRSSRFVIVFIGVDGVVILFVIVFIGVDGVVIFIL
tara:strand:+ start:10082 stop:10207 length:126 start_codon:yes stop_codon:yes gene_type:complete